MLDGKCIAGTHLDKTFIEDLQRPVDQLLRWHFSQAVVANMRGQGEPLFDSDFPPGSDTIGEFMDRLWACERVRVEVRLNCSAGIL